jgi:hypothetical protein
MLNGVGGRSRLFALALYATSCGTPGVVEVQPVPRGGATASVDAGADVDASDMASACPSDWHCMDLSAIGEATDGAGDPITASCSMGGIMPCDEADPRSSCAGLPKPVCVHLNVGGQAIVSCGQRCTP